MTYFVVLFLKLRKKMLVGEIVFYFVTLTLRLRFYLTVILWMCNMFGGVKNKFFFLIWWLVNVSETWQFLWHFASNVINFSSKVFFSGDYLLINFTSYYTIFLQLLNEIYIWWAAPLQFEEVSFHVEIWLFLNHLYFFHILFIFLRF
jgi:hypothetical protein